MESIAQSYLAIEERTKDCLVQTLKEAEMHINRRRKTEKFNKGGLAMKRRPASNSKRHQCDSDFGVNGKSDL